MYFQLKFCLLLFFSVSSVKSRSKPFNGLVSIQNSMKLHLCGGVLLDLDFVVTSAKCLIKPEGEFYEKHELFVFNNTLVETTSKKVESLLIHTNNNENDVALLKIEPFDEPEIADILTAIDTPEVDEDCKIHGWLRQVFFGKNVKKQPNYQSTSVKIIKSRECSSETNSSANICLSVSYPCYGLGSALVCDDILAGLGSTCQVRGKKMQKFTDLSKFNIWIDAVVRASVYNDVKALMKLTKQFNTPISNNDEDKIVFLDPEDSIDKRVEIKNDDDDSETFFEVNTPINENNLNVVCESCFKECTPIWSDPSSVNAWLSNHNCKRGILYPYSCFYTVKKYIYDKNTGNDFVTNYEYFTQYINSFSDKFWENYRKYADYFNIYSNIKI
uniref:CSON003055 protein n=1 Tax=Culicoides sonorensis TaxID=179676 RepID=A0A336L4S2_CULSO